MEVIKKFMNCSEVFSQAEKLSPDVILLDLDADIKEGIDAIPQLTAKTKAKVLILTGSRDFTVHDRTMLSGARGIVGKEETVETILRAIERIHADQLWLDRAGTSRLVLELSRRKPVEKYSPEREKMKLLTAREKEIVEFLAVHAGVTSKVMAEKLHISDSTLRNHLGSIYGKLGVTSRLGLWDYVGKNGLNKKTVP